jgi:hypothetical protein
MSITSDREALHANLARRNPKMARIYLGGLRVLADEDNPCKYELAAHSLREVMKNCPVLAGFQPFGSGDSMTKRLENVRAAYYAALQNQNLGERAPNVTEDADNALVSELGRFFKWQDENRPQRRTRVAETLAALSGPVLALPSDIAEGEVNGWMGAWDYLNKTAHHSEEAIIREEFLRHVNLVESILLRRLQPRAVEEHDAIDALIREGEGGN